MRGMGQKTTLLRFRSTSPAREARVVATKELLAMDDLAHLGARRSLLRWPRQRAGFSPCLQPAH
jgi:hypothetical protein